jgi:hypothetical protein
MKPRIWGCEREEARSHPQIRILLNWSKSSNISKSVFYLPEYIPIIKGIKRIPIIQK